MDYKVITAKSTGIFSTDFESTADRLTTAVREQISLGWEPLGGVAVSDSGMTTPHLFQAMIKRR